MCIFLDFVQNIFNYNNYSPFRNNKTLKLSNIEQKNGSNNNILVKCLLSGLSWKLKKKEKCSIKGETSFRVTSVLSETKSPKIIQIMNTKVSWIYVLFHLRNSYFVSQSKSFLYFIFSFWHLLSFWPSSFASVLVHDLLSFP